MLATKQYARVDESQSNSSKPNLRTKTAKEMPLRDRVLILSAIVVSAGVVWYVASIGARIDRMNYNIDHLQTQVQKAAAENASLTAQVDQLSQPARILEIAKNKLHMQYKNAVQVGVQSNVQN